MSKSKPIICVDFDGVIHDYKKGWQNGEIYGDVVPGFFEWYFSPVSKYFDIQIYSSRSKDPVMLHKMEEWLRYQYISWHQNYQYKPFPFTFAHEKPPAFLTIDDRAICFKGDWGASELSVEALKTFKPWNITESEGENK